MNTIIILYYQTVRKILHLAAFVPYLAIQTTKTNYYCINSIRMDLLGAPHGWDNSWKND